MTTDAAARTVFEAFAATVERWAERPFFHVPYLAARAYSDTAVEWRYGEACARVRALAARYAEAGLHAGHRVALLLGNRADFFLNYLALNSLGVSIVPLNGEATAAEVEHILRDSRSILVVSLGEGEALLANACARLEQPPQCAYMDVKGEFRVARVRGSPGPVPTDEAALLYTSGSTGDPKGCIIPNAYMLGMGRWYRAMGGLCQIEDGQERLITPLPLVHMNALAASGMGMLMSGGCIVQLDRFHPSTWWPAVRASRATVAHYLGVMPAMLLQASPSAADRDHALKFGFGAGVHTKHHAAFEKRFGFPLVESWSMTEVGAGAAVVAQHEPRHIGTRCFGRPGPDVELRIVDEQGNDVPQGCEGELLVRASGADPRSGFFAGYANQPALTEAAWKHGYFHTGDVVRMSEDGSLHFVDRQKSIIRRSGENIASLEVEAVLNEIPHVRSVGVGPVDDEIRGEEVIACVQLADGYAASIQTAKEIFASAALRLTYFKLPGYIAFLEHLPLTASQKLQRGVLKQVSRTLVAQGLAFDLRALKKRSLTQRSAA